MKLTIESANDLSPDTKDWNNQKYSVSDMKGDSTTISELVEYFHAAAIAIGFTGEMTRKAMKKFVKEYSE